MYAILRKKKSWENYHEKQISELSVAGLEVVFRGFQIALVVASLSLFLVYRLGVFVVKILFVRPKLVRRIDPYRVEEVEEFGASGRGQWSP